MHPFRVVGREGFWWTKLFPTFLLTCTIYHRLLFGNHRWLTGNCCKTITIIGDRHNKIATYTSTRPTESNRMVGMCCNRHREEIKTTYTRLISVPKDAKQITIRFFGQPRQDNANNAGPHALSGKGLVVHGGHLYSWQTIAGDSYLRT